MIHQQINLYDERFREKKILLSAAQAASVFLILLLGVGGWSYFIQTNLDQARQENLIIKDSRQKLVNELNAASAELARLLADSRIDAKITGVSREIGARKKVLAFVSANQFGSGQGFSSYLVALSELHVENVWLDEISLAENYIKIRGSALSAELIPEYFGRFSEQSIFRGNRFNIFKVDRKQETDWKVDFEIATNGTLDE
ncbi:MAG: PilN domain-containing protein [Gammaproteobacteria bacterium]|nr:PilN domain-containing protein [Gammaproteobacteria bacterium]MCZ6669117.1 PilN domain-containing protein [Gammaproteobacteria bacterium]